MTQPVSVNNVSGQNAMFKGGGVFIIAFIFLWLAFQALVPLRHHLVPGSVAWNEAGHRFSWRMKLRSKSGTATFYVIRENGDTTEVDPADYLRFKQVRKMVCIPDLIWQFAQFLETELKVGDEDLKVYVDTKCSLNTREHAPFVRRLVDLTAIPRDEPINNWIYPLTKELPNRFF